MLLLIGGLFLSFSITRYTLLDQYLQLILMYIGINIILALSLNLVNGYMGEFSVGHAGFMSIGAYVASLTTVKAFSVVPSILLFPIGIDRRRVERRTVRHDRLYPFIPDTGRLPRHRYPRV